MPELHETRMGQKLITHDIPELIKAINRMAAALEKLAGQMPTGTKSTEEVLQIWKKANE